MSKTVKVSLGGETIATGTLRPCTLAFWHRVEVDDAYDMERLISRLHAIFMDRGIHFEISTSGTVQFAPAYKVEEVVLLGDEGAIS